MNFKLIFTIFILIFAFNLVEAAESSSAFETMMKVMVETIGGFIGVIWNQISQLLGSSGSSGGGVDPKMRYKEQNNEN